MKYVSLLAIVAIVLPGCDVSTDLGNKIATAYPAKTPNVVFSPGHKMKVGDEVAPVLGNGECPSAGKAMRLLFGPNPDEGQHSCIVIAPETTEVFVTVGLKEGATREIWKVERSGERIMLRRADGSYLASAN
ncbi:hypothetical protein [Herbaspirillum sp. RV1423]|uniref:hypothetical protein n=1 Tax=Herbaspirillum sp. RV1423 TaxID=1443993 RepID=UPI0005540304|nr:hypothetical protein [Herbaspirillum sp. RV1423]